MRTTFFLIVAFCFTSLAAFSQQTDWYSKLKELKFLSSSKQDVMRIFDFESKLALDPNYYQRDDWDVDLPSGGTLQFYFRDDKLCGNEKGYGNVAPGTLTEVIFYSNNSPVSLDKLPIKTAGFKTHEGTVARSIVSRKKGITIIGDDSNRWLVILFDPPSSLNYLRCPASPEPDQFVSTGERLDLSITIQDPYIPRLTVKQHVVVGRPFVFTKQLGVVSLRISGVVGDQKDHKWPTTVRISEYSSHRDNISESVRLDMELGKSISIGPIASVAYLRTYTLK